MTRAHRSFATLLVMAALVMPLGCQQTSPSPSASTPPAAPGLEALRALAYARLNEGDHAGALRALEGAVRLAPGDVALRYLLAVTFTHLDRREDAIATFTWVVEQGRPGSDEVTFARQWLASAGVLPSPAAVAVASADDDAAVAGTLGGTLEWPHLDPELGAPTVQILLTGDDSAVQGKRYGTKAPLNKRYRFDNVPAGRYRLIAQAGMTRLWDLSVTIDDGKPTVLNLTQASSVAPPDALRPTP